MDKKALSEVVSYVFLIVVAISLSVIVYAFLQSTIPKSKLECSDSLGIIIKGVKCGLNPNQINITFENKGRFDIDGIYARYSNNTGGAASNPLIPISSSHGEINRITSDRANEGFLYFGGIYDTPIPLRANKEYTQIFQFNDGDLKGFQIQPFLNDEKTRELIICEEKSISQEINCP